MDYIENVLLLWSELFKSVSLNFSYFFIFLTGVFFVIFCIKILSFLIKGSY